jgi:HEAT repeat protein
MTTTWRLALLLALALATPSAKGAEVLGKSIEKWTEQLHSKSATQRHQAAWALAHAPASPEASSVLQAELAHEDPVVRYWCVQGVARTKAIEMLRPMLRDDSASVRLAAAEGLVRCGQTDAGVEALAAGLSHPDEFVRLQAIQSLERLGLLAARARPAIRQATDDANEYVKRIAVRMVAGFDAKN